MKRLFSYYIVLLSIGLSQYTTFYCDPWAQRSYSDYQIENNIWGQGEINDYSKWIFTTNDSSFGWNWTWPVLNLEMKL